MNLLDESVYVIGRVGIGLVCFEDMSLCKLWVIVKEWVSWLFLFFGD